MPMVMGECENRRVTESYARNIPDATYLIRPVVMARLKIILSSWRTCGTYRSPTAVASPRSLVFASFFNPNQRWSGMRPGHTQPAGALNAQSSSPPVPLSAYRLSPSLTARTLPKLYTQLSKSRLTFLVVLTSMAGVAISPLPASVPTLLATAVGTALCSASANALNQLQEVPFDAQMVRTRTRPLVRKAISSLHATGFAVVTGTLGPILLYTMANPTTAALGLANIALYAGAYTRMKRRTIWNTWAGAVVGAIPPLMGWTACGGKLLPSATYTPEYFLPSFLSGPTVSSIDHTLIDNPLGPIALFMLLFSWQFPHFNALSHLYRGSYAQAGYKMLSVLSPAKNALVSLRYAGILIPTCSILFPLSGLTTWTFAATSLIPGSILLRAAWRMWRTGSEKDARSLFQHSLWHLPAILGLMMIHKNGVDWSEWFGGKS
ncbi:protoheme IX farnesyltransferase [Thelephora ganbajun]|uniref:Protoheme IX farnesyltransferase n=1 Tax=Thelephora ganbajun TaxID=370292 RepID=A0ACB6ZLR6_THEGA|nr:protoheme IX farnesyltransferase [Thelephora ganbajun]